MGTRYKGRHRRPSQARRNTAIAVTTGAAVAMPLVGASAAQAAELAPAVDWAPIIACESGGNPTAQNPSSSASGLFQIVDGTWKAYGGSTAHAFQASVSEQTAVAERIYAASGLGPWSASKPCWGGKVNTAAPKSVPLVPKTTKAAPKATPKAAAPKVSKPVVKPKATTSWAEAAGGVYTVHKGDTLSGIAAAHGKPSWQDVYQRNRDIVGANPNLILPGQQIQL